MLTKSYKSLKELVRVNNISSVELALAVYSIKYLSEQNNHFSEKLNLRTLIQNPISVKEQLKEMFYFIENELSDFSEVYSRLDIPWDIIENKILFDICLTVQKDQDIDYNLLTEEIQADIGLSRDTLSHFTTPRFIQELMVSLLDIENNSSFYDATAGLAGMLLEANRQNKDMNLKFYGQDFNANSWAVGKLLLLLSGMQKSQYELGNILTNPAYFEGEQLKRFDYIATAMPLGMPISPQEKEQIDNDPYGRFVYGRVPQKSADMAYVQHAISSSTGKGRVVLLVTNGMLFRGGSEATIRQTLIDMDQIESVISLSDNLLTHATIPINILILNKNKSSNKKGRIKFIKADHLYQTVKRQKFLSKEHIAKIVELVNDSSDQESNSKTIDISHVTDNLLVNKYIKNDKTIIDGNTYKVFFDKLENVSEQTFKFEDIGKFYKGLNTTPTNSSEEEKGEFKIIKMSDVHDGQIQIKELTNISFKKNMKIDPYIVEEGDVLISSRGYVQKIAVVPPHQGMIVLSHNFIAIRPNKKIVDPYFLKLYLDSPIGKFTLDDMTSGTSIPSLNAKDLEKANLYLPELPIQHSVVNRYNKAQHDYEELLKKAQYQLKAEKDLAYKDSGLKSFFELVE